MQGSEIVRGPSRQHRRTRRPRRIRKSMIINYYYAKELSQTAQIFQRRSAFDATLPHHEDHEVTKDLDRIFLLNFAFFACFAVKSVAQCRTAPRLGSLSSILGGCVAALRLWTGEENSRYIFPHLAALGGREQRAVAAFSSASFHDLDQ
jgi:hypothetical protein